MIRNTKREFILRTNDLEFTCIAHLRCIPQFNNDHGGAGFTGYLIMNVLDTTPEEIKDIPCKFCESIDEP